MQKVSCVINRYQIANFSSVSRGFFLFFLFLFIYLFFVLPRPGHNISQDGFSLD